MNRLKEKLTFWLRKSEKYTKTDMVYLFSSNFWLNINKFLSIGNGLVLAIAFANLISKEEYGVYAFVLAITGLFSMPPTTGLGAGIVKEAARGNHAVIFEGMKKVLPWSLASGSALVLAGLYYWLKGNTVLSVCFALSGASLPILVSNSSAKSLLSSIGDFRMLAIFNLWRTPLSTAILVSALFFSSSVLWVLIANILSNLFLGLFLYRAVKKKYALRSQEKTEGKFAGAYAFHSAILSIFGYLSEKIDSIMLWKFLGAAPVAVYSYALSPIRELRGVLENQGAAAIPKFAKKEFSDVRANILFRIKQFYIIVAPAVFLYILSAPYIFRLIFPQYIESVLISQVASLLLLTSPKVLLSGAISSHQKIMESYIMIVAPNAIRILLAFMLIPTFGLWGALVAFLTYEILQYAILGMLLFITKR